MAMIAWCAFTRDQRFQLRGVVALFTSWVFLGNILAVAFSSVGPCFYFEFYGDRTFLPLMERLQSYTDGFGLRATQAMQFLLQTSGKEAWGAGISAMPSLHVAMATLFVLFCRHRFNAIWPTVLASIFLMLILVGSVHLGWHYAVDGIVSIIVAPLIWWASGRFVDWAEARELRRRGAAQGSVAELVAA